MGSVAGRARQLESVVSICIVALLFLIGAGVLLKQSNYDIGRFGTDPNAAGVVEPQTAEETADAELALDSLVPQGFKTFSEIEVYEPENLYEKINGKAPLYIESGFVRLFTQRFINNSDEALWMELFVYDMAVIRNAFSVYSVQKRAGVELLPSMQFAYRTSNGLYFVHGKYYVELLGSSESAELLKAMGQVAGKIGSDLRVNKDARITELALFPEKDLILGSTKLYLANTFGFEGLTDTFAARYKFGDEAITAFLSKKDSADEATRVFESYYRFLLDNGGKEISTTNPKAKFVDFYGTLEIVSAVGPFVFGIHEAENPQLAREVYKRILNKLVETAEMPQDD